MMMKKRKHDEETDTNPMDHAADPGTPEQPEPEASAPAGTTEPATEPAQAGPTAAEQIAALNDKYLRLYSEFDNYRKRTLKEKIELSKMASAEIIIRLLPVLDDLERAIQAHDQASEAGIALKEGVILILNKFMTILNQQGLEQIKSAGEPFNTDFHEAITSIPAPAPEQKGKIIDEIEKGYLLGGKVIRYAKVVVGS